MSFASIVSEFNFELPVPITSSNPMPNKEKPGIDIDEVKNSDMSKELLQINTKEIKKLRRERKNALEKIKKLENKDIFFENLKDNHAEF